MLLRTFQRVVISGLCAIALTATGRAQAHYTASRVADIQFGAGYTSANSDYEYVHNRIAGPYFYADVSLWEHFGFEGSFHQLSDPNSAVYQRTFELGGRYIRHYNLGRFDFQPYVKAQAGRGILNFPKYANLGYYLVGLSGGADISVLPRVNVRAEYEFQDWFNAPGQGLHITPNMITLGVAYHFPAGKPK